MLIELKLIGKYMAKIIENIIYNLKRKLGLEEALVLKLAWNENVCLKPIASSY